jgi:hypothetical protein
MESTRLDLSGLCVQSNDGHSFSKEIDSHQLVQWMRAGEGRIEVKLSLQYLHHHRFNFTVYPTALTNDSRRRKRVLAALLLVLATTPMMALPVDLVVA